MISPSRKPLVEAAAIFALALGIRLAGIGQEAFGDELFHVLAARQYLHDGTLIIGGTDPYTRVRGFTLLVAALFRFFGESLAVGRLPALLCGSALPAVAFLWVQRVSDRPAAWLAALLLCLNPDLIAVSQMVRFYAPQELAFLLASIAVFALIATPGRRQRIGLALGAVLALAVAVYCQVITLVGVAALGLWAAAMWATPVWRWSARRPSRRAWLAVGTGLGIVLAILLLLRTGAARHFWETAAFVPLWQADTAHNPFFYHWYLSKDYPALWTVAPLLGVVALLRRPRLAAYCATIFLVTFATLSILPPKNGRYLLYVMPHLLVLNAVGAAAALGALARQVGAYLEQRQIAGATWAGGTVVAALSILTAATNPGITQSLRRLGTDQSHTYPGYDGPPLSWREAATLLRPLIDSTTVVVSTDGLKSLYYLGRLDYVLSRTDLVTEHGVAPEFSATPYLGAPAISRPESLARLMRCHSSGVLVSAAYALETRWRLPLETQALVRSALRPIALPGRSGVVALAWQRADPPPRDCAAP